MFKKKLLILIIFAFLTVPSMTIAAVLSIEPNSGAYGPGDSFIATVKIEANSGCINTIEATIKFPSNTLFLEELLTGNSLLNIWLEKPATADLNKINDVGEIYLAGGIPGGYCGKIPGDPGESNIVAQLAFRVPGFSVGSDAAEQADIYFTGKTRVLLNDGLGSEDRLIKKGATFEILDKAANMNVDWEELVKHDLIPPEPFVIEVHQNDRVFEGKYYIIFYTTDKQTGVDHYEVLEIRPEDQAGQKPRLSWWQRLMGKEVLAPDWVVAEMPYLLKDQTLKSIIKVRAVDKAGNERQVEYIPPASSQAGVKAADRLEKIKIFYIVGGAALLVIFLMIIINALKRRARHSRYEE